MAEHREGRPSGNADAANSSNRRRQSSRAQPRRKALRDELVVVDHPTQGRVAMLLPVIPEDAPYRVREGVARRRTTAVTGWCPCGAELDYRAWVNVAQVAHQRGCPADTDTLVRLIRGWLR